MLATALLLSAIALVTVRSKFSGAPFETLLAESKLSDNRVLAPLQAALAAPEAQQYRHQVNSKKRNNIALLKTYKTAGGTLASVLFRFASRHHSRIFPGESLSNVHFKQLLYSWPSNRTMLARSQCNTIMRHSVSPLSAPHPMPVMIEFFNHIIDRPFVITVLREPIGHMLSYLYFFEVQDISEHGLTETINKLAPTNPQCKELGIDTEEDLNRFIESEMYLFDMICLTEYFDECMVMLRRRMNWDMVDVTYLRVHDADEGDMYV